MKKILPVFLLILAISLNACSPLAVKSTATQAPVISQPTEVNPTPTTKQYSNSQFGLEFQFPSNWFGPEEYVSDQTLRVEAGSDVVYPYGERPETPPTVLNSYNLVLQYTKNDQNTDWQETYQSLLKLKDGESISSTRSLITRVRQIAVGNFKGFEYIFTLPESAQTDHVYSRNVILLNGQTNDLITILGQPVNVEVLNGADWREIYQALDEANLSAFRMVVDSLTIN